MPRLPASPDTFFGVALCTYDIDAYYLESDINYLQIKNAREYILSDVPSEQVDFHHVGNSRTVRLVLGDKD